MKNITLLFIICLLTFVSCSPNAAESPHKLISAQEIEPKVSAVLLKKGSNFDYSRITFVIVQVEGKKFLLTAYPFGANIVVTQIQ